MVSMMVFYDDYLRRLTVMVTVVVIGVGYDGQKIRPKRSERYIKTKI